MKSARQMYISKWRKQKKEREIKAGVADPVSESTHRGRACRTCGESVEPSSYWYCKEHNILSCESDDDNRYGTFINMDGQHGGLTLSDSYD